jgi:murein DD-endopeptidase MepM/ murein hydrolase activator NlpD
MKRKLLVTITDTERFRQYTLDEVLKYIAAAILLVIVTGTVSFYLYFRWLEESYAEAKAKEKVLTQRIESLNRQIEKRQIALDRLGDRLSDLEIMVGQKSEADYDTSTRLENVTLSAAQLALLFSIVPNGSPVPMEGITSAFGWRTHPIRKTREFHAGIDLRAKRHKPVWTTADGVVEYAGYHKRSGYGNLVIIDHGFGFKTYYGHLKKVTVRTGDTVIKGDVIGLSGNTGLSTAPHLHYEIRFLSRPLNPYWFLKWKKERYTDIFRKVKKVPWESFIALTGHMAATALPPSSPPARK